MKRTSLEGPRNRESDLLMRDYRATLPLPAPPTSAAPLTPFLPPFRARELAILEFYFVI